MLRKDSLPEVLRHHPLKDMLSQGSNPCLTAISTKSTSESRGASKLERLMSVGSSTSDPRSLAVDSPLPDFDIAPAKT